ncbi:MAG: DUF2520 domain-containing protein [Bacteroidales bacterium]|nr:DUF2520 domain-containing protein [Bacteroidales bacterium]
MEAIQNIVIIGAGNVGRHLALSMRDSGLTISQVAGRREPSVIALADEMNTSHSLSFEDILKGQDLYILALPDQAMEEILPKLPLRDELLVHTSGSVPMSMLAPYSDNVGVFYPLQTFTGQRKIGLKEVPILIEANRIDNESRLIGLGQKLSKKVIGVNSRQRQALHIAAVFACNFSNHMYDIARQILDENQLDFELLAPLINETAAKAISLGPEKSRTGPAHRKDMQIIEKHLDLLKDNKAARELYQKISESIIDQTK